MFIDYHVVLVGSLLFACLPCVSLFGANRIRVEYDRVFLWAPRLSHEENTQCWSCGRDCDGHSGGKHQEKIKKLSLHVGKNDLCR